VRVSNVTCCQLTVVVRAQWSRQSSLLRSSWVHHPNISDEDAYKEYMRSVDKKQTHCASSINPFNLFKSDFLSSLYRPFFSLSLSLSLSLLLFSLHLSLSLSLSLLSLPLSLWPSLCQEIGLQDRYGQDLVCVSTNCAHRERFASRRPHEANPRTGGSLNNRFLGLWCGGLPRSLGGLARTTTQDHVSPVAR